MTEFDPYFEWLGILPSQQPADHYRLLGLPRFETNMAEIASAADQRLALVGCHQGGPHDEAARQLAAQIFQARACLLDVQQKAAYDATLHLHVGGRPGYVPMQPPVHALLPPGVASDAQYAALPMPEVQLPPAALPGSIPPSAAASLPPTVAPSTGAESAAESAAAGEPLGEPEDAAEEAAPASSRRVWIVVGGLLVLTLVLTALSVAGLMALAKRGTSAVAENPAGDGTTDAPGPDAVVPPPIIDETPIVEPGPADELLLDAGSAQVHGPDLRRGVSGGREVLTNWASIDDWAEWRLRVPKGGQYKLEITYSASSGSGTYVLESDLARIAVRGTVRSNGTGGAMVTEGDRRIVFPRRGLTTLTMRATEVPGKELMTLQSIRMVYDPVQSRRE